MKKLPCGWCQSLPKKSSPSRRSLLCVQAPRLRAFKSLLKCLAHPQTLHSKTLAIPLHGPSWGNPPPRGFPGAGVTKQIVDHKGDELKAGTGRYLLGGSPHGLRRKRKPTQTGVSIQLMLFLAMVFASKGSTQFPKPSYNPFPPSNESWRLARPVIQREMAGLFVWSLCVAIGIHWIRSEKRSRSLWDTSRLGSEKETRAMEQDEACL